MAWEFSTDPEFQEKLEWMDHFVREEVWPLETLHLERATLMPVIEPLREQVKAGGL